MTGMTDPGRYFEDFRLGERIRHAVPRTLTTGDAAVYLGLTGSRFVLHCADSVARSLGYRQAPIDDVLVFHIVFGRTVPDISLNAIANLGYAEGRFGVPVYPGDTLATESEVIGLKETSSRDTGIVYVRSTGTNQDGATVLDYVRWVLVRKRDRASAAPDPVVPKLAAFVAPETLIVPAGIDAARWDGALAGTSKLWDDYQPGMRIDHVDGMTIEESCHMTAARLYQNNARVHFNQHVEAQGRFGKRIVYGGHIISLARALSANGLAAGFRVAAINGGRHTNPSFAGDTIYGWSEILTRAELPGRRDVGALRLRTVACKNRAAGDFPDKTEAGETDPSVVLDLDYWVLAPRRG